MDDRGHNRHGTKRRGLLCPFRGELGLRVIQCGLSRGLLPYQVVSLPIQPFGHNRHEPKTGGSCAPFRGELRPHLTQRRLGRGLSPYQVACLSIHLFGHNRHGPKIGCAFFRAAAGSPSNTKSTGPRPTSIPSGILVHPAVSPQRILAENWGLCPFRGGELHGSPSIHNVA